MTHKFGLNHLYIRIGFLASNMPNKGPFVEISEINSISHLSYSTYYTGFSH